MKKKITSIKQLRAEHRKLKIQAEASKQLFFESLSETKKHATAFAVSKILLPTGAAGAAIWGAKKIFGASEEAEDNTHSENGQGVLAAMLPKLLPLGISLVNAYLTKEMVEEEMD
jgi:hypothetical protein